MSLINDALKRAKQTQQENPPPTPTLEFRPVEAGQNENRRTSLLLVGIALVIVALLGLGGSLVWFISQKKSSTMKVEARAAQRNVASATNTLPPTPSKPAVAEVIESHEKVATKDGAVVAVVEAPKPPPLKLQGIFFNPKNPSAVVSGKTVYLGERVSGFFVLGISPTSVTLADGSITNVLSLSE